MKLSNDGELRRAVHVAFAVGVVGAGVGTSEAIAQESGATQLQGVEVTGSRIRRVDTETSDPVFVLDRKSIESSGSANLGQLLQSLPIVTGAVTNPQVNNGGGTGAATIALRGLGAVRTLVLLDGKRIVTTNAVDVNAYPTNLIDRIEILKEGAAAVYGSDAIGGVVNIITRKNFKGAEFNAQYGQTQAGDAQQEIVDGTWGATTKGGKVVLGFQYNRQDEIKSSDRYITSAPFGFYYGQLTPLFGSSSRSPFGAYTVPGVGRVTRIDGTPGTSPTDFRPFRNNFGPDPAGSDRYNFQPFNLALTPQKRYSLFGSGDQKVSENTSWFVSAYYNSTRANNQLAPEPVDNATVAALTGGQPVIISAQNAYNPFGRDISSYAIRANAAGPRIAAFDTSNYQLTTGFKGTLLDRFVWDADYTYGRILSTSNTVGFLNFSQIAQQLGPSFFDANGIATCGTPGAPIPTSSCRPLDIFGTSANNLASLNTDTHSRADTDLSQITTSISGDLFSLPAGTVGAALGFEYRSLHYDFTPDQLAQEFHLSEGNSQATRGGFNVREFYGEVNIPVVKNLPGVKRLDVTVGGRYSNFSSFNGTATGKYGIEWRPYSDLLVRGSYSDVFRAPTVTNLFAGPAQNAPVYTDPCRGLTTPVGVNANIDAACQNVVRDGSFRATNTQATANVTSNPNLKPEKGYATNFGLVFNPSFYKPLTVTADYYTYQIKDAINTLAYQTVLDACFNFGSFCNDVGRGPDGQVALGIQPTTNSDKFFTQGLDLGLRFSYPKTLLGNVTFGVDGTYLQKFLNTTSTPDGVLLASSSTAGQYDANTFGAAFPRVRLYGYLYWNKGPWSATLVDRFIGDQTENGIDLGQTSTGPTGAPACANGVSSDVNAYGSTFLCKRKIGSANYVDLTGSYSIKSIGTTLTVGINDLFSEGSQFVATGFNGATDTGLYDIRGRNFYGRVKVDFK